MTGTVEKIKSVIPGTTEYAAKQDATDLTTAHGGGPHTGTHTHSSTATTGYGSGTGGVGSAGAGYGGASHVGVGSGLTSGAPTTGGHPGHSHGHHGHSHGHHGHSHGHNTHTTHTSHSTGDVASAGLGSATGGAVGSTVDTRHQTATEGVTKHVPGTEAHREHSANQSLGTDDRATGNYGAGHAASDLTGKATGGAVGSNIGTENDSVKEKILKHIPGTDANKEKKAQQDVGI